MDVKTKELSELNWVKEQIEDLLRSSTLKWAMAYNPMKRLWYVKFEEGDKNERDFI